MSIPILCRNLLVLLATIYPVSLPQIAANFTKKSTGKNSQEIYLASSVFISVFLLLLSWALIQQPDFVTLPSSYIWFFLAVAAAPLLIILEYIVGAILLVAKRIRASGLAVNANWTRLSKAGCIFTILLAIVEELIYRQLWSVIILDNLGLHVAGFILISSFVYGFNHLYYGFSTFLQKAVSGVILSLLYLLSGRSILIPLVAHSLQNAVILLMGEVQIKRTEQYGLG